MRETDGRSVKTCEMESVVLKKDTKTKRQERYQAEFTQRAEEDMRRSRTKF